MGALGFSLQWRHNGCDSVSDHQPHDCLLNRLFRRRSKKTSKLHVTGLCVGNSPGTGEFPPTQMASYEENVSIWWCHHVMQNYALKWLYFLAKLRVYQHFEDAPRRPMITCTIDSYWIPSKNKTKLKLQIFAKTSNFRILKKLFTWYTFWSCLIRCVKKIWIRQVLLKIQSRHDSIHRRTDGWMDRWTDEQGETNYISTFIFIE